VRKLLSLILLLVPAILAADVERGAPLPRKGMIGIGTASDPHGLKVTAVVPGGAGEKAGLQTGDIIESLNGKKVTDPAGFAAAIHNMNGGDKFAFRYLRDGKEAEADGVLIARPQATETDLDVIYEQVVSRNKRIRIIITKPKSAGPFPALFLIGGIGAYSVDAPFKSMPYGNVMGPIANAGYATVRIDKPGQGDSEGPAYKDLTFNQEADAYLQALRLVKTLPYIDPARIVLYGHSMGGCFAPVVAAQEPVKAVIANGTLFASFDEYMLENTRRQAELGDAPEDQLDQELKQLNAIDCLIFDKGMSPADVEKRDPDLAASAKGTFPDGQTYSGVGIPFFRDLEHTNLALAWSKAKCDALLVYSENDFLSGRADHERIAAWVNRLRPGTAEFKLIPNMDHVFTKTTSMRDSMAKWGKGGEFNPAIVETIETFLKKEVGD